jgi:zinc transport system permease protein
MSAVVTPLAQLGWALDALGGGMCGLGELFGIELLCYSFMQRAIVAGVCVGVVAPLVGSFLVYRRMSLIGDALAHAAFAGVAIGLFLASTVSIAVSPYLTALVVAVLAALAIQLLVERTDADGDVSMAIVLSGGFALGTVLVSVSSGGISVSINQYLFGSLTTVTRQSASILVLLSVAVVAVVAVAYRPFLYATFDETAARVAGIDVGRYNRLLVVLTAVVVVAAMQIMGVILVAAMLVVPVAAAAHVADSFARAVALSVVAAEVAVLSGIGLSYSYGLAAGGTIVLVAIGVYGLAAAIGRVAPSIGR